MAKGGIPIKPRTPSQLGSFRKTVTPVVAPGIGKMKAPKLVPKKCDNYIKGNRGKAL